MGPRQARRLFGGVAYRGHVMTLWGEARKARAPMRRLREAHDEPITNLCSERCLKETPPLWARRTLRGPR